MKTENKNIIPECIGVIMDGNRRWAKKKGLPSFRGHQEGYKKMKAIIGWAKKLGIKNVVTFALSAENWNRSKEEVGCFMELLRFALGREIGSLIKEKVRVIFVGEKSDFPKDIEKMMNDVEKETKKYKDFTLAVAVSYGGRKEIVSAFNKLSFLKKKNIDEKNVCSVLWTKDVPDPDLIIRTGGQKRLSGFLPWQSVYSELFFIDELWPDFSEKEFGEIIKKYAEIQRNFGK